jgi:hypothetical protein
MQKTIAGNFYDTETDEEIVNQDGEKESVVLYRTEGGRYYLEVRKWQLFVNGAWENYSSGYDDDGLRDRLPKEYCRVFTLIRPFTMEQAIDWYVTNIVPDCFQARFREDCRERPGRSPSSSATASDLLR